MRELERHFTQLDQLKCHLVLVSFGETHGALKWHEENEINDSRFDMITDHDRTIYKYFHLPKSYSKVWSSSTLIYYAEQVRQSRSLPKSYQDIEDDPHQMGGDFILKFNTDQHDLPRPVFVYKSKTPPDRPSAKSIIEFLTQYK